MMKKKRKKQNQKLQSPDLGQLLELIHFTKNKLLGKGIGKPQTMRKFQKIYIRQMTKVCNI